MHESVAGVSKDGHCEQCGLEITTGMMAALCPQARNCCLWPRSDGTAELDGAELLFAKLWMDNACEQIGLQIDERKRLEAENAELRRSLSDTDAVLADHDRLVRALDAALCGGESAAPQASLCDLIVPVSCLRAKCIEMDEALSAIYEKATSTLLTASRDIGDWIDDVEAIGLLASNED